MLDDVASISNTVAASMPKRPRASDARILARMRPHDVTPSESATHAEPIVAVFDTKTMALRTIAELGAAELDDYWLAVVRGESDDGETTVAEEGGEVLLHRALAERGSNAALASRFDGILPPGPAVVSLRPGRKSDEAIRIIEVTGGHIEHL